MAIHVEPEIYQGRPVDDGARLPREREVYTLLDQLGIFYERADHDVAATIEDCAAIEALLQAPICKNLFLCNRQQTQFYLLLMEGHKPFHTKDLSKLLGVSRLSFANETFMEELLHISPGSVSVMGLMNDTENRVQLVIDRPVAEAPLIGCHPCINTSTLRLKTHDVLEVFLPGVHHTPIIVDLPTEPMEEKQC